MMAVSGQTHFRESNNDWSKGVVFGGDSVGLGWVGVPGLCTTVKLRHTATVNVMCSFYMFEFGGVADSQARAQSETQNGTLESGLVRDETTSNGRIYPPPGSFLKNELTHRYDEDGTHRNRTFGYETKVAGYVRLSINGRTYQSTSRPIYTSHVDSRKPYNFPYNDGFETREADYYASGEMLSATISQNGYIFMPMIGRHQHHITFQVDLAEGIHDIGLVFKANAVTSSQSTLSSADHMDEGYFLSLKGFPKPSAPKVPNSKNVFFLSRNLVVDCYYKDNDPM